MKYTRPESPLKALLFSVGPSKTSSQRPNLKTKHSHKGKMDNSSAGALLSPKSNAPLDQSLPSKFVATRPCTSISSALFDGTFKSKCEPPREMGYSGGGSSDQNPNCSDRGDPCQLDT